MNDKTFLWQPPVIGALVVQAGMEALAQQLEIRGTTKEDSTLVTKADTETEEFLIRELEKLHAGARILGEETWQTAGFESMKSELEKDLFILDPIDGTSIYAAGLPGWGVSVGYVHDKEMAHGAVFLPGSGELYITTDVHAAYLRMPLDRFGIPIVPPDRDALEDFIAQRLLPLVVRESQPVELVSVTQYIAKGMSFRVPFTVISTGSFVVSMLNTARGSFSAYMAKAKIWDMAGAWPIARQAGVRGIMVPSGKEFEVSLDKGPWDWNPESPSFLGLHEHVLFYRNEIIAQKCRETAELWE